MGLSKEQQIQLIACITELAHRHGQRDYMTGKNGSEVVMSHLCGLTVFYQGLQAIRMKSHDLDLEYACYPLDAANDVDASREDRGAALRYIEGDHETLSAWHNKLSNLHRFLCPEGRESGILCFTQVAA